MYVVGFLNATSLEMNTEPQLQLSPLARIFSQPLSKYPLFLRVKDINPSCEVYRKQNRRQTAIQVENTDTATGRTCSELIALGDDISLGNPSAPSFLCAREITIDLRKSARLIKKPECEYMHIHPYYALGREGRKPFSTLL